MHQATPTPAALSPARDPVLLGLVGATLAAVVWGMVGTGGQAVSWALQAALDAIFVVCCRRVAQLAGEVGPSRRFWRFMAHGGVLFTVADSFQTVLTIIHPASDPNNSPLQTVLVASGVSCVVWVMLTHPIEAAGQERLRLWLDAATVMVSVAVFTWVALGGGWTSGSATDLIGGALMLVCSFGMVKLLLSGTAPFTLPAGIAGGLAAGLNGVASSMDPVFAHTPFPHLVTVARLLPCFLLTATPRIQELGMRRDPASLAARRRPYSRLPYVAVAATQGLMVYLCVTEGLTLRTWGAICGVLGITAVVVVRQLVAFQDNASLLRRLSQQEERFRSLVQHASDITVVIDLDSTITYASPAVFRVLGVTPEEATGSHIDAWVHPEDQSTADDLMADLRREPGDSLATQIRAKCRDGSWRWLEVIGTNLLDNASVHGVVLNARDVTEARQLHDRLQYEATHDPLTGLANRALFEERLRVASLDSRPAGDGDEYTAELTLIAIDLNKFKEVNDVLGHHVGDGLLQTVADRLRQSVRPTDTVARLGGDEFAVLLPYTSMAGARIVADRIVAAFETPAHVHGHTVPVLASLGLATGTPDDTEALLREADAAMYVAKGESRRTTQPV
ncbi:MAG TPA: diguanylate cyclase [Rugosimonospora sp.]|nr:diguanylate cyclase [Rugosimonospora sp.]